MSSAKATIWAASIAAVASVIVALIMLAQHDSPGNQINQQSPGGNNIACQDHSTCISS